MNVAKIIILIYLELMNQVYFFEFYENYKLKSDCNIQIQVSDLNNMPINNTSSTNQTFFNYSNGKKLNMNFSK